MDDAFTFTQRRDITLLLGVLISAIILVVCCLLLPIFAVDQNTIAIPTTEYPINFDGNVVFDNEWKDAYNISFPGARSDGQNVTVYLKYGSNDRVLYGAFTIPGRSSVPPQSDSNEGIHFLFDVTGNANEYLDGNDHDIALYRDGVVQYSIGDKEQKTWIENATSSGALETELPLQDPFSKIDYRIIPAADRWGGEFRIFFKPESELPTLYSFSLLAETDMITRTGEQTHKTTYYPPSSNRVNPSTWTKISFEGTPQIIDLRPNISGLKARITGEARPSEPDGEIANIHIDWGNGEEENLKKFPVSHIYSDPGRYNITVTVTDNNGLNAIKRISVNVPGEPEPGEPEPGEPEPGEPEPGEPEPGEPEPGEPEPGTSITESPWYQKPEIIVLIEVIIGSIVAAIITSIIGPIVVEHYRQKKRSRDRSNRKRR
jgi:hypothetical protein